MSSPLEKLRPRKIFGYHLILDLYGCDPKAINSKRICRKYLNDLVSLMKVHKQAPPVVIYTDPTKYPDKAGISGWVAIVESGCSIHTVTPTLFASVDIYSCKKFDRQKVKNFTIKTFKPKEIEERYFLRGKKYTHPGR